MIPDVHKAWSLWGAAALAAFDTLHTVLPTLSDFIPPTAFGIINVVAAVAIAFLRVIKQENME